MPLWQIVITSSLCAAVVTQGFSVIRDLVGRREAGKIAALYAAMSLERFAAECLGHAISRDLERLQHLSFPDLKSDIDMKAIGISMAQRLLGLDLDARYLPNVYRKDLTEEMRIDWTLMALSLGQKSIATADLIRRKFWLGPSRGSRVDDTRARLRALADELSLSES